MPEVFVGIGSNVAPEQHVPQALQALRECFGALRVSTAYRNPAVGFDGDDFINLVVAFDCTRALDELAVDLAEIERAHGRTRTEAKFSPRTLDLDLLLYGSTVRLNEAPTVPRPEILERAFVLGPLAELAPELVHPTAGRSMAELWAAHGVDANMVPVEIERES